MVGPLSYFSFQPVLRDWGNRLWYVLSSLWNVIYPYCYLERVAIVAAAGFLFRHLNVLLPYVRCHKTIKECVEGVVK